MIYSLVLVNKPVINSDKNEKVGKVKKYVVDPATKKVVAFILVPEPGQSALDIVPYSNVKSVYNNAVIIENMPSLIKMSEAPEILNTFMLDVPIIGLQVITDTGMMAGTVRDFAFREKDGLLVRLSLAPDKDSVTRIHAKHIITIAKQRIIISALALKEDVTDEEPEEEVAAHMSAPARVENKEEAGEMESVAEERKTSGTEVASEKETPTAHYETEEPVVSRPGPASYSRMQGDGASIEEVKTVMKEMFAEMSEVLLSRLNILVVKENLDEMKKEVISALKETADKENDAPSLEILVEEKIKRGAGRHLEEIKETLADISKAVEVSGNEQKILEKIDSILKSVSDAGNKTVEAVRESVKDSKPEVINIKELAAEISNSVEKVVREVEAAVPGKDEIASQLRDFATRYEERAGAILTTAKAEMDRHAEMLGLTAEGGSILRETAAREMLDELRAGVLSALESASLKEKLGEVLSEVKNSGDRMSSEVNSAAGKMETALKETLESTSLREKLEEVLSEVKGTGDKVSSEVNSAAGKMETALKQTLESASLHERFEEAAAGLKAAGEKISGEVRQAAGSMEAAVRDALENEKAERSGLGENFRTELENQRHVLIEEIKSFAESAMKPDDLEVVRQWIGELKNADDGEKLAEVLREVGGEIENKVSAAVNAGTNRLDEVTGAMSQKLEIKINSIADAAGKAGSETEKIIEDLSNAIDSMKTGILDSRQEIGIIKDQVAAKQEDFSAALKDLAGTLESKVSSLLDKAAQHQPVSGDELRDMKDTLLSGINEIRGGVGADIERRISDAASGQEEKIENIRKAMEDAAHRAGALQESIAAGIKEELSARLSEVHGRLTGEINGILEDAAQKASALQENIAVGIKEELSSRLSEVHGRLTGEINGILEGRLGNVADASDLQGIKEQLESRIMSAVEDIKVNIEKRHGGVLDEIKSLFGSRELAIQDITSKLDARNADAPRELEALKDYIEKIVSPIVDGVKKNLEDRMAGVAGISDLETVRQKIEEKFGDVSDRVVESIEKRLDERDEQLGQGMQAILKKVEKAFQGGGRSQASSQEGIFGGGGILNAIFGAGRSENEPPPTASPSMKISSRTERPSGSARFAKGSDILEENHIRRLAYLIGKKLRQDVVDPHGNILATEGTMVDEDMIRRLRDAHCTLPLIRSVDFGD